MLDFDWICDWSFDDSTVLDCFGQCSGGWSGTGIETERLLIVSFRRTAARPSPESNLDLRGVWISEWGVS